jgi:MFS family permease
MEPKKTRTFLGLQRNAFVLSFTELLHDSGNHLVMSFWSLYILHLGGTIATLGLFSIIRGFCNVFFQLILGYLSDRFSRKKQIILGGFIAALGPFLLSFANNWVLLIPGIIIMSFDRSLWSTRQAFFADNVSIERRGQSLATFWTIFGLSSSFLPAIGGIILDTFGLGFGFRLGLYYSGFAKIVQTLCNARFLTEDNTRTDSQPVPKEFRKFDVSSIKEIVREFFSPIVENKTLQVMMIGQSIVSVSMGLVSRFTIVYAVDFIGLTNTEWGLIIAISNFVNTILRIPMGTITDMYGRRLTILISYFVQTIYPFFFYNAKTVFHVLILTLINSIGRNMGNTSWHALQLDITQSRERGRLYGIFGAISGYGGIISAASPSLGAFLWDEYGPIVPFYLATAFRASAAIYFLVFLKEAKTDKR